MKYDLEEILRNTLLEKKKDHSERFVNGSLEELVKGRYLDGGKRVYLSENKWCLPLELGSTRLRKTDISDVITTWSKAGQIGDEDLLFLDTETTGLQGGAGTWVFMTGLGFFAENCFTIKQYFLADPEGEEEYLKYLQEEFSLRKVFVTYNGRSYDINLLKTRFIMNRLAFGELEKPNIDLLYLVRRLWGNHLTDCRLLTLEREILGRERNDEDLASSEIPERYYEFLETGRTEFMGKVFYHNREDIYSLPFLLQKTSGCFDYSDADLRDEPVSDIGIARLLLEQGKKAAALRFLKVGSRKKDGISCRRELSKLLKQGGKFEEALRIWEREEEKDFFELEELAKYYEHKIKNLPLALEWTEKALDRLDNQEEIKVKANERWLYRRKRLIKKMKRKSEKTN